MYRRILIAAVSAVVATGQVAAQETTLLSASAQAEMAGARAANTRSIARQSLHVVGGALLGAGLGYFASHVAYNDWEKTADSSFSEKRRTYSISGAAVGAIAGLVVGRKGGTSGPGAVPPYLRGSDGVETIARGEIAASSATNVYEAVQSLRPNWLNVRGVHNFTETGRLTGGERNLTASGGMPQIRTYLDWATLGEVEQLRAIPLHEVQAIQFLSPAQAAHRFGAGHAHGAIVVFTGVLPNGGIQGVVP